MENRNLWTSVVLFLLALGIGISKDHLYLKPEGREHSFFTNESFVITCFASEDSSATRLTWQSPSGQDITVSEGRVYVAPVAQNPQALQLKIEEMKSKDAGIYRCSAIVDGLEVTTFFKLLVYRSISFAHTPPIQVAPEDSNFTIFCNVKTDLQPVMSWYFRGRRLAPGSKYQITEDGLVVHKIVKEDTGNYTCRALVITPRNSQVKDTHIFVQVKYSPQWKKINVQRGYGVIGSFTNLSCEASANPAPNFEWIKHGETLSNNNIFTIVRDEDKSVLQIYVHNVSVFGDYLCRVSNTLGTKEKTITLEVGAKPFSPRILASSEQPGMLTLFIDYSEEINDNLVILGYKVEYRLSSEAWTEAKGQEFGVASKYHLKNLEYGMLYVIRAAARNAAGYGTYSLEVTQRTRRLLPDTEADGAVLNESSNLLLLTLLCLVEYIKE